MKEVKIESVFQVYETILETPEEVQELMERAVEARQKAYAPYSQFHVGVALFLDNNQVVTGSNQENASYPSGLCAERTAIYYAGAQYPNAKILKMAITAASQLKPTLSPIPPCGACRQAISEYEIRQKTPIEMYFMGESGKVVRSHSLSNLLPLIFDKSQL
ncbi:cytidine deaminase [Mangrovimonas xylaniphaga]|uniref:cytidine deaminase n=1 Tax=Mangrovimonas xylaniphaga TaxID=1645915 RepID=UPI0006B5DB1A|nr:cytidine deaminase [Mangrovimonas xylaniphaga]